MQIEQNTKTYPHQLYIVQHIVFVTVSIQYCIVSFYHLYHMHMSTRLKSMCGMKFYLLDS